jgi:molybdopterin converting factor small subunit
MKINIAIFGRRYDLGPQHPGVLDLPIGATVDDALGILQRDVCTREFVVPSALVAVSGNHIGTIGNHPAEPLRDNDELLIFAPVAGG